MMVTVAEMTMVTVTVLMTALTLRTVSADNNKQKWEVMATLTMERAIV